jgi:hypothetical protein
MVSQSKIDTRKAILRARGVPEKFIDNLATRNSRGKAGAFFLIAVLVCLAGFLTVTTFSPQIEALLVPVLYREAMGSLLFYLPDAFLSLVPATCAIAFVSALVAIMFETVRWLRAIEPYPAYSSYAELLRTERPDEIAATIQPNPAYVNFADLADDTAFLKAIFPQKKSSAWRFLPTIFLFACMALPLYRTISPEMSGLFDYKDATLEAVRLRTSKGMVTYPLKDAKYAYVLCYDEPSRIGFAYKLVYPNKTISLWRRRDLLHNLGPEQVLERLNRIDTELTRLHVPVHRMPMTGSPYDDALSCIDSAAKEWELKDTKGLRHLVFGE